ncbi:MAG: hypothetical protein ACRDTZ_01085 [Pseudonocardiaceae bacterium]
MTNLATPRVDGRWFVFEQGLAHTVWLTRHGRALSWCLTAHQPVTVLRAPADGDPVCRACWDATQAGAA